VKLFSWARWQPSATQAEWHFVASNAANYELQIMDGGICAEDGGLLDLGSKILGRIFKPKSNAGVGNVCVFQVHNFRFNVRCFLPSTSGSAPFYIEFAEGSFWDDWDITISGIYGKVINTNTINDANCHIVKLVAVCDKARISNNKNLRIENESETAMITPFAIHNQFASRPIKRPVICGNTNIQLKANHGVVATMGREVTYGYIDNGAIHDNEFYVETFGSDVPTIHGASHLLLNSSNSGYRCNNVTYGAVIGSLTKESTATSFNNELHNPVTVGAYAKGTLDGAKFFDEVIYVKSGDLRVEQATNSNDIDCINAAFFRTQVMCLDDVELTNTDEISSLLTVGGIGDDSTATSYGMVISDSIAQPPVAARIGSVNYDTIADWNMAEGADVKSNSAKINISIGGVPSSQIINMVCETQNGEGVASLYGEVIPSSGVITISIPDTDNQSINYTVKNSSFTGAAIGVADII
jgi:hypothetical protein